MTSPRLDAELVRRGLARSRARAAALVSDGKVTVDGAPARKSAQPVGDTAEIVVAEQDDDVSRGAQKLSGALDAVARLAPGALDPDGARCLDAGASTGGFTQVLLRRGAAHVLAVDVGHGQLDPSLARDPRVTAFEGVNVRELDLAALAGAGGSGPVPVATPVDLVVADLSFISLRTVVTALVRATRPGGQLLLLVKPQFEVGRGRLGRGGVVVSPELRVEVVDAVADALAGLGVRLRAVVPSALAGEAGNREYFLWAVREADAGRADRPGWTSDGRERVRRAVQTSEPVLLEVPPTTAATPATAATHGDGGGTP